MDNFLFFLSSTWILWAFLYAAGLAVSYSESTSYTITRTDDDGSFKMFDAVRDGTPLDVWKAIIWPIRGVFWFSVWMVSMLWDVAKFFLLGFGLKLKGDINDD